MHKVTKNRQVNSDLIRSNLRPALFLDRDGVINIEKNYVCRPEDFEFTQGIFDLCRKAKDLDMAIVVVTNQAGIGRGYYSEQQFHQLTDWMLAQFMAKGIDIDAVYFCPFHPEYGIGEYKAESFDRKPNPGMILRALKDLGLEPSGSILVGDKHSDIAAAKAAGLGLSILIADELKVNESVPDIRVSTLPEVIDYLAETWVSGASDTRVDYCG